MISEASSHASSYGGSQLLVGACGANGISRRTDAGMDADGDEEVEAGGSIVVPGAVSDSVTTDDEEFGIGSTGACMTD